MFAAYVQRGETLDYINSTNATIKLGDLVAIGDHYGVAGDDIAAGATGAVHMIGVFDMTKDSAAINLGANVFLVSNKISATKGQSGKLVGYAVAAAAATDTTVRVMIGVGTAE